MCWRCLLGEPHAGKQKKVLPQTSSTLVFNNVTESECVTYCMYKESPVISYNSFEQICLLDKTPCHQLLPNNPFTIQTKQIKPDTLCISWRHFDGQIPDRSIQDTSVRMVFVAIKFPRKGLLLPAKYEVGINSVFSVLNGVGIGEVAYSSNMEFLVVDPLCRTMWITYNSAGSETLPRNAVIAGHKENGIALYFARMWIRILPSYRILIWLLWPQNSYGYSHLYGALEKTRMDVLCIAWQTKHYIAGNPSHG